MRFRIPCRPAILLPLLVVLFAPPVAEQASAGNLHLIDSLPNGFAIYRSGKPDRDDMAEYCELGITEIAVLAGNAKDAEFKYRDACPTLEVVYDEKQEAGKPVSEAFIEWFDSWVQSARSEGKKIAFRCNCGCHRTGRLAAYYQMKYQNLTVEDALLVMYGHGRYWSRNRGIEPQVRALADYLNGVPCSQTPKWCLRTDEPLSDRPAVANE